ncbi:transcription initiation factor TFIID subunit 12-like [Leptidea sinapis]|uniref:transcription initiation factor TFIID subunit 12-like n=1 Tax=Leptidea sinapis TaxID=189913 RepID=UPI0021C2DC1D|nr:transcription initiation factor TFIID subunit 12-like [Leptidea sinapis]XP_050674474.1 transcription initiation factor TFIID subunit 12-like [Leptidea sinapis]
MNLDREGMSSNLGRGANMPSIGKINQGSNQYGNNSLQIPQSTSSQGPPAQYSPISQSQGANKNNQSGDQGSQPLTRQKLQELVREVDPTAQLDEDVEETLLTLADDFMKSVVNSSCALAKHRRAPNVELKDVQLHLEKQWNMWIPGFGNNKPQPYKRAGVTEAHKQRMALIRKATKKY